MRTRYGRGYTAQLDKDGAEAFERLKRAVDNGVFAKVRGDWVFRGRYNADLTAAFDEAAASSEWDEPGIGTSRTATITHFICQANLLLFMALSSLSANRIYLRHTRSLCNK